MNDDPGERARVYLENARKCADMLNRAYLPVVEQATGNDRAWVAQLATMNAILAIAEMTVPPPPGLRG